MACHIDFRNQVLDGKRGEWTGFSKTSLHARKQPGLNEARRDKRPAGALTPLEQRELDEHSSMQVTEQSVRSVDPTATHGKVSGRGWKAKQAARSSAVAKSRVSTSWEKKMALKAEKKAFQVRKEQLKERVKANKRESRRLAEERKKKKEENEMKSMVVQRITNPRTVKKMSKKQRDKLVTVSEDMVTKRTK